MAAREVVRTETRGDIARAVLLDAAERLFAERGIEGVSLRDICAAAGQRNHSAAQYHFGDRRGVVAAVFERRMGIVNDRRHTLLDRWEAAGDRHDMCGLVAALAIPLTEVVAETDGWYARFLARTQWDTFAAEVVADLTVGTSYRRALDLLTAATALPADLRRLRFDQLGTLLIGTIAGWEWQGHRRSRRVTLASLQGELISTLGAVLSAPIHGSIP